jgi:glycogen operon protein
MTTTPRLAEAPIRLGAALISKNVAQFGVCIPFYAQSASVALFAPHSGDGEPDLEIELTSSTDSPWADWNGRIAHGIVEGVGENWGYAFRLKPRTDCWPKDQAAFSPGNARLINPNKLILDPYARAIYRELRWHDSLFPIKPGTACEMSTAPNGLHCPIGAIVSDHTYEWYNDQCLRIPWEDTVIWETHVAGFTRNRPGSKYPGTFADLGSKKSIEYLRRLGITAVQLMPVFASTPNKANQRHFWRYWTRGFFMLEPSYSFYSRPSNTVREFQGMVRNLHRAGIEVILDVVYNHTAEGNHLGEAFSLKLLDDGAYYRKCSGGRGDEPRGDYYYYYDLTGCGNTLNVNSPLVLRLILDSLRYWVEVMHVDGFRFDLASALALSNPDHEGKLHLHCELFRMILADPILGKVKIIVEPYTAAGQYHLGEFPKGVIEISDQFKWTTRRYWRRDGLRDEMAMLLSGGRRFVGGQQNLEKRGVWSVCGHANHDGLTTSDVVTYHQRRNTDGELEVVTIPIGEDGPTKDPKTQFRRQRVVRALLATSLLNPGGVPMFLYGDEVYRTQHGHNNPYLLDDERVWMQWGASQNLIEFCNKLIQLRHQHTVFRRMFREPVAPLGDWIKFYDELGQEHSLETLGHYNRRLGILLLAQELKAKFLVQDSPIYLAYCPGDSRVSYKLPELDIPGCWFRIFSSFPRDLANQFKVRGLEQGRSILRPRSMAVFRFQKVDFF